MFGGRRAAVVAASAVALAGGGAGLAAASSQGINKPTTIHVLVKHLAFQAVNNNGKKNMGDGLVFSAPMWNAAGTRKIGHWDAACTETRANNSQFLCNTVFTFAGRGEITTTGLAPSNGAPDTDPIVGGDGAFRNASGQAHTGRFHTPIKITLELDP